MDLLTRPFLTWAYKLRIIGQDNVPRHGPAILAANHESVLDPWFLATCTPRQVHYMAKAELFRQPAVGAILRGLGCVPVERGTDRGVAINHAARLLREDKLVGIFPQGTCLPLERRRYRRGAARLALTTQAPLIPLALVGTEHALQPKTHRIGFPTVTILAGEPLAIESAHSLKAATELTTRLEAAIEALRAEVPTGSTRNARAHGLA